MGLLSAIDTGLDVLSSMDMVSPLVYTLMSKRENRFSTVAENGPWLEKMFKRVGIPMIRIWLFAGEWHFAVPEGYSQKARAVIAAADSGMPDEEMIQRFGPKKKAGKGGLIADIAKALRDL